MRRLRYVRAVLIFPPAAFRVAALSNWPAQFASRHGLCLARARSSQAREYAHACSLPCTIVTAICSQRASMSHGSVASGLWLCGSLASFLSELSPPLVSALHRFVVLFVSCQIRDPPYTVPFPWQPNAREDGGGWVLIAALITVGSSWWLSFHHSVTLI